MSAAKKALTRYLFSSQTHRYEAYSRHTGTEKDLRLASASLHYLGGQPLKGRKSGAEAGAFHTSETTKKDDIKIADPGLHKATVGGHQEAIDVLQASRTPFSNMFEPLKGQGKSCIDMIKKMDQLVK